MTEWSRVRAAFREGNRPWSVRPLSKLAPRSGVSSTSRSANPGVPSFVPCARSATGIDSAGRLSKKNVLRWSLSKSTSVSARASSRTARICPNS